MFNRARSVLTAVGLAAVAMSASGQTQAPPDRAKILDAMKRATSFMVDKVSTNGGSTYTSISGATSIPDLPS